MGIKDKEFVIGLSMYILAIAFCILMICLLAINSEKGHRECERYGYEYAETYIFGDTFCYNRVLLEELGE